jgi:hypothetical protein
MAEQATVMSDIRTIENALRDYVGGPGKSHIYVFESSEPYLRAIVVSDHFLGHGVTARQNEIWTFLDGTLPPDVRRRLFGVHPYTWEEYRRSFPASSASPFSEEPPAG